jgi:carbamoyl-phosphate synthase large subunit
MSGSAFISVKELDKKYLSKLIPLLVEHKFSLVATKGTGEAIRNLGYQTKIINKFSEGRPHVVDELVNDSINLLINTTEGRQSIEESALIRRTALQKKLFCVTTIFGAFAVLEAMSTNSDDWIYNSLQEIN